MEHSPSGSLKSHFRRGNGERYSKLPFWPQPVELGRFDKRQDIGRALAISYSPFEPQTAKAYEGPQGTYAESDALSGTFGGGMEPREKS